MRQTRSASRSSAAAHFGPGLFGFLTELAAHNDRDWFAAHKARYDREVKAPLLAFIADAGPRLAAFAPHVVADPSPAGGSMFRIHRDVRFSRDKSPYKTAASAQFRHASGKDVHAPGFYLHLEPGNVFAVGGVWRPDAPALARIREAIVDDPVAWKRAVGGKRFRERARLAGDALVRSPRGLDPEHPLIDDLKRKDFIAVVELDAAAVTRPGFLGLFLDACKAAAPLCRFVSGALGHPF